MLHRLAMLLLFAGSARAAHEVAFGLSGRPKPSAAAIRERSRPASAPEMASDSASASAGYR